MSVMSLLTALLLSNAAFAEPADSSLNGQWTTDCLPIGKNGRHGIITHVTIAGDRIEASSQIYAKNSCDTPTILGKFSGSIVGKKAEDDHTDLDLAVGSVTLTLTAKDVVDGYNKSMKENPGCASIVWRENETVSVAGKNCGPLLFPEKGAHLFDRAWIQEDRLLFGAMPTNWQNITPDKRPTVPLEAVYYRTGR